MCAFSNCRRNKKAGGGYFASIGYLKIVSFCVAKFAGCLTNAIYSKINNRQATNLFCPFYCL